jgi:hypothetical protein
MIQAEIVADAKDIARAFRVLRKLEPDLISRFRKDMKGDLSPLAKAIAAKYPSAPYLSNLGGYRRITFNKTKNAIVVKDNWVWSDVVGKVAVTPGRSRKGAGRDNLVSLRMEYKGAIPWVTDLSSMESEKLTPQGKALVRNINSRFPNWPRGGRIFYKEFLRNRGLVMDKAEKIMGKFIDDVNKVI